MIEEFRTERLVYLQADGRFTTLYYITELQVLKNISATLNIGQFKRCLPPFFYRTHKNYIVNLKYLEKTVNHKKDSCYISLSVGGLYIPVSGRRRTNFLKSAIRIK